MKTTRMEAFSDGVLAIIITIMVLELKVPRGEDWASIAPLLPVFGSYVMSFAYIAIYWNNHHHMLHVTERISGPILWANLHLLFWLSLIPFASGWMGENHFATRPTALYGGVLFMCAIAYTILQSAIIRRQGEASALRRALGADVKGKASIVLYVAGIGLAFVNPWLGVALYAAVACMWFVPDRRIARAAEGGG